MQVLNTNLLEAQRKKTSRSHMMCTHARIIILLFYNQPHNNKQQVHHQLTHRIASQRIAFNQTQHHNIVQYNLTNSKWQRQVRRQRPGINRPWPNITLVN